MIRKKAAAGAEVSFLNAEFYTGKAAGIRIKTSPNVKSITTKNASEDNRVETLTYSNTVGGQRGRVSHLPNYSDYEVIATITSEIPQ